MARALEFDGAVYGVVVDGGVCVFEFRRSVLDALADLGQKADLLRRFADAAQAPGIDAILFRNLHDTFGEDEVRRFHDRLFGPDRELDSYTADNVFAREECGLHQLIEALQQSPRATAIALQGRVVGPFFGLALAFDVRLATRDLVFSAMPVDGIPCGGGLGLFLPRYVGLGRARQILLGGEDLPARRARDLGLVTQIVDSGRREQQALEATRRCVAAGPHAAIIRDLCNPVSAEELAGYFERECRLLKRACHTVPA